MEGRKGRISNFSDAEISTNRQSQMHTGMRAICLRDRTIYVSRKKCGTKEGGGDNDCMGRSTVSVETEMPKSWRELEMGDMDRRRRPGPCD